MPLFARRSYRFELTAVCFLSITLAMVEGALTGVIIKKAFGGIVPDRPLNLAVALLAAAPEFTNLTSFLWTRLAHARHKVRIINMLQIGLALVVGAMALTPRTESGLWLIGACIITARALYAGIVTLRANVWRANYSRADRARATGKLAIIQSFTVAAAGFIVGAAMDSSPHSFRVIFPVAMLSGLIGASFYARVRVRRHKLLLNAERAMDPDERPSFSPHSMVRVLAADRNYAFFMLFMFILGSGNLMLLAPLIVILDQQFGLGYSGSITITQTVPLIAIILGIPLWTRFLDRVHIVRFRALHSWVFVVAQGLILLGSVLHWLPLIYLGIATVGIGYAGGTLAWNLGHLDFAPPHLASQYMAIHLTLNGLRGLLAPLVGISLQNVLSDREAGQWVFAVSVLFCIIGAVGFGWLQRRMGATASTRPAH